MILENYAFQHMVWGQIPLVEQVLVPNASFFAKRIYVGWQASKLCGTAGVLATTGGHYQANTYMTCSHAVFQQTMQTFSNEVASRCRLTRKLIQRIYHTEKKSQIKLWKLDICN